jgi:predicted transposase YdaD
MRDHAAEIIHPLVPGAELIHGENVELDGEESRADLVYWVLYKDQKHLIDLELQSGPDSEMQYRMLFYHVELLIQHKQPVISVVLYLFESSLPENPFREKSREEELLTFRYRIITLWTLDVQEYMQGHVIAMYTLLPGMRGADAPLLIQAIKEMEQAYTRPQFGDHLLRFRTILRRSTRVSAQDKQIVEAYMIQNKYDSLIDEDPEIRERMARAEAEGKAEGEVEGEIRGLQKSVLSIIRKRFPALVESAEQQVAQLRDTEDLERLVVYLLDASDEAAARWLLKIPRSNSTTTTDN